MNYLRQYGLIELHDRGTGRDQSLDLLAKHPNDIFAERLSRLVGAIRYALQPHRSREEVGARECHLDRAIGQPLDCGQLVCGQGAGGISRQPSEDGGMPDRLGRNVERPQLARELVGMLDVGQQVDDRDELAVLKPAADEARVAVAPLLAIGHHINPGLELRLDHLGHSAVCHGLKLAVIKTPFQAFVKRS